MASGDLISRSWRALTRVFAGDPTKPRSDPESPLSAARETALTMSRWTVAAANGPDRVAPLVRDLRHRKAAVRARAADALGELGVEEAIEPLTVAACDPRSDVRRAVLVALWRLSPDVFAETAVRLVSAVPRDALLADLDAVAAIASDPRLYEAELSPTGVVNDGTH